MTVGGTGRDDEELDCATGARDRSCSESVAGSSSDVEDCLGGHGSRLAGAFCAGA